MSDICVLPRTVVKTVQYQVLQTCIIHPSLSPIQNLLVSIDCLVPIKMTILRRKTSPEQCEARRIHGTHPFIPPFIHIIHQQRTSQMVRLSSLVHPFGLIRRSFAALINTDYPQTSGQLATIIVNPPRVGFSSDCLNTRTEGHYCTSYTTLCTIVINTHDANAAGFIEGRLFRFLWSHAPQLSSHHFLSFSFFLVVPSRQLIKVTSVEQFLAPFQRSKKETNFLLMLNPFPKYEDKWRLKQVISKDNKEYKINTHTPWQNKQTNKSLYVYSSCVKSTKGET